MKIISKTKTLLCYRIDNTDKYKQSILIGIASTCVNVNEYPPGIWSIRSSTPKPLSYFYDDDSYPCVLSFALEESHLIWRCYEYSVSPVLCIYSSMNNINFCLKKQPWSWRVCYIVVIDWAMAARRIDINITCMVHMQITYQMSWKYPISKQYHHNMTILYICL